MTHNEYIGKIALSPKLFRGFYLCCAAWAKYTQGDAIANKCQYIFSEPGRLPYLVITAVRYGNTTDILINNKYFRTVEI